MFAIKNLRRSLHSCLVLKSNSIKIPRPSSGLLSVAKPFIIEEHEIKSYFADDDKNFYPRAVSNLSKAYAKQDLDIQKSMFNVDSVKSVHKIRLLNDPLVNEDGHTGQTFLITNQLYSSIIRSTNELNTREERIDEWREFCFKPKIGFMYDYFYFEGYNKLAFLLLLYRFKNRLDIKDINNKFNKSTSKSEQIQIIKKLYNTIITDEDEYSSLLHTECEFIEHLKFPEILF